MPRCFLLKKICLIKFFLTFVKLPAIKYSHELLITVSGWHRDHKSFTIALFFLLGLSHRPLWQLKAMSYNSLVLSLLMILGCVGTWELLKAQDPRMKQLWGGGCLQNSTGKNEKITYSLYFFVPDNCDICHSDTVSQWLRVKDKIDHLHKPGDLLAVSRAAWEQFVSCPGPITFSC